MARLLVAVMVFLVIGAVVASPVAKVVKRQAEREDPPAETEPPESNDINPSTKQEESKPDEVPETSDDKPAETPEATEDKPAETTEASEEKPAESPETSDEKSAQSEGSDEKSSESPEVNGESGDQTTIEPSVTRQHHHHHHSHFNPGFFNFGGYKDTGGVFQSPRFPIFRPIYTNMHRFFDQVFDSVKNETSSLPENYNETKTESAEVDGKNYQVKTTVIKKSNNDTSVFVRILSIRPSSDQDNSTEVQEKEAGETTTISTSTSEPRVKRSNHDDDDDDDHDDDDDDDHDDDDDD